MVTTQAPPLQPQGTQPQTPLTCRTPTHDDGGGCGPQAGVLAARRWAVDKHLLLEG